MKYMLLLLTLVSSVTHTMETLTALRPPVCNTMNEYAQLVPENQSWSLSQQEKQQYISTLYKNPSYQQIENNPKQHQKELKQLICTTQQEQCTHIQFFGSAIGWKKWLLGLSCCLGGAITGQSSCCIGGTWLCAAGCHQAHKNHRPAAGAAHSLQKNQIFLQVIAPLVME